MLRFFRERAGLTQEGLGNHVKYSKSQVAMVERGERAPKGCLVGIADDVLGAQGALSLLAKKEFKDNGLRPWTEDYLAEERKAASILSYQNHVIPGLLQTEAYARAVYSCNFCPAIDDEELETRVADRLARQQIFERKPLPTLGFIVEQSVLTRPLGGRKVLKEQLLHMLDVGRRRHVHLQVMPHDRESHASLMGPLILLETAERTQLAYIEGHKGGYFVSEQPDLGNLIGKYGILRAHALSPEKSATLIEKVAHEL
ncbi:helix-turn-helix domain-containing protein [Streptomyces sp. p1417]|uniref:Helix-turn-helix domain-containing protein n=2 Tax=Streptomyces typhae TaxID=2681492 RepID=A0A6L6WWH1_9ACTN|nr:helix-turn-helix transcriptional regulator [Streptomyces typhae]MVO86139.1 helix-turn-helix domain-containing protein [Streptomyces typhae]